MELSEKTRIESLAKKAARGNVNAYGALITYYQDYLYRVAFLYVKNEDLALDAVGECILEAFRSIRTLQKPEYFKTWLTRILIRCSARVFKQTIVCAPTDMTDTIQPAAPEPSVMPEEKWDLYDAIDVLPEKYRTVIILRYFSDLSIREIASVMEIPEGSVKSYLNRAKAALRTTLKEDYYYAT